jgi:hypothetical protein
VSTHCKPIVGYFTRPEDLINIDELEGDALAYELKQRARKPEAQYTPWLFVQAPIYKQANY